MWHRGRALLTLLAAPRAQRDSLVPAASRVLPGADWSATRHRFHGYRGHAQPLRTRRSAGQPAFERADPEVCRLLVQHIEAMCRCGALVGPPSRSMTPRPPSAGLPCARAGGGPRRGGRSSTPNAPAASAAREHRQANGRPNARNVSRARWFNSPASSWLRFSTPRLADHFQVDDRPELGQLPLDPFQ